MVRFWVAFLKAETVRFTDRLGLESGKEESRLTQIS